MGLTEIGTRQRLSVGIIGCGKAGMQHAAALRTLHGVEIAGTFDVNAAAFIENVESFSTFDELLRAEPNAIAFCSPPGTRQVQIKKAIEHGIGVLVEKPPAISSNELSEIVDLAASLNVPIHCMLQHRYRVPRAMLGLDATDAVGSLIVSRYRPPNSLVSGWHGEKTLSGGGIVTHLGIHYLDVALEWLGSPMEFRLTSISLLASGIEYSLTGVFMLEGGATLSVAFTGAVNGRIEALHVVANNFTSSLIDGRYLFDGCTPSSYEGDVLSPAELRISVYKDFLAAVAGEELFDDRCALRRTSRIQRALEMLQQVVAS